jgi:hypothetical protein
MIAMNSKIVDSANDGQADISEARERFDSGVYIPVCRNYDLANVDSCGAW